MPVQLTGSCQCDRGGQPASAGPSRSIQLEGRPPPRPPRPAEGQPGPGARARARDRGLATGKGNHPKDLPAAAALFIDTVTQLTRTAPPPRPLRLGQARARRVQFRGLTFVKCSQVVVTGGCRRRSGQLPGPACPCSARVTLGGSCSI